MVNGWNNYLKYFERNRLNFDGDQLTTVNMCPNNFKNAATCAHENWTRSSFSEF